MTITCWTANLAPSGLSMWSKFGVLSEAAAVGQRVCVHGQDYGELGEEAWR